MTFEIIEACERCGLGVPVYRVFSDVIDMLTCKACAEEAQSLPHKHPGALTVYALRQPEE